jgi:hypothetical protein
VPHSKAYTEGRAINQHTGDEILGEYIKYKFRIGSVSLTDAMPSPVLWHADAASKTWFRATTTFTKEEIGEKGLSVSRRASALRVSECLPESATTE